MILTTKKTCWWRSIFLAGCWQRCSPCTMARFWCCFHIFHDHQRCMNYLASSNLELWCLVVIMRQHIIINFEQKMKINHGDLCWHESLFLLTIYWQLISFHNVSCYLEQQGIVIVVCYSQEYGKRKFVSMTIDFYDLTHNNLWFWKISHEK